eukprot:4033447-Amphidinium_carterae.1
MSSILLGALFAIELQLNSNVQQMSSVFGRKVSSKCPASFLEHFCYRTAVKLKCPANVQRFCPQNVQQII